MGKHLHNFQRIRRGVGTIMRVALPQRLELVQLEASCNDLILRQHREVCCKYVEHTSRILECVVLSRVHILPRLRCGQLLHKLLMRESH